MKRFLNFLKKVLTNGGLFVLVGVFTYRTIFASSDFRLVIHHASQSHFAFLLCGAAMVALMLCAETVTVQRNLRLLGETQSFRQCLIYTFAGNFFSAITPAATGGQPMEVYLMHKKGVSTIHGMLALVMDLVCYQLATTLLGIAGYLTFGSLIHSLLGNYIWLLWLGLGLNTGLLILLLFAMFSQRFIFHLTELAVRLISLFSKDRANTFQKSAETAIAQYRTSAELFQRNKRYCFVNCLITVIRILAMHSAPFWVYKALGLSGASVLQIIALQSALYISCAALPFPGGIGIAERSFLHYFKTVFPGTLLQSSMILSRAIGSYMTITLSGSVLAAVFVLSMFRKKQKLCRKSFPGKAFDQPDCASRCKCCVNTQMQLSTVTAFWQRKMEKMEESMKRSYKVVATLFTAAVGTGFLVYWLNYQMPLREYTANALYMAVLDDEISRRELMGLAVFPSKKESLQYKYHLFLELNRKRSRKDIQQEIDQLESRLNSLNEREEVVGVEP